MDTLSIRSNVIHEQKQWKMVSSSSLVNHYIIIFAQVTGDKVGLADEHLSTNSTKITRLIVIYF